MLCQAFFLYLCRSFEYILWDFGVCKCVCLYVYVHMCFSCFSFGSFSDVCLFVKARYILLFYLILLLLLLLYTCLYSNESVWGFGYVKKRRDSWRSWGREPLSGYIILKMTTQLKKKKLQEKETRKISEQYGSMHIRTKHYRSKTEGK